MSLRQFLKDSWRMLLAGEMRLKGGEVAAAAPQASPSVVTVKIGSRLFRCTGCGNTYACDNPNEVIVAGVCHICEGMRDFSFVGTLMPSWPWREMRRFRRARATIPDSDRKPLP